MAMLLSLTACGSGDASEEQMITRPKDAEAVILEETKSPAPAEAAPAETASAQKASAPAAAESYIFFASGVELVPGTVFDPGILPEPDSVSEVPSCAIEGTDNVYNYGTFELTAFDDGTSEVIYSILLTDPNITTTEGLALGDSADKVVELYGEGYTQQGNAYVFTAGAQSLYIILQGQSVVSIEYRMITE
ncbi:MAG: hypothetical protein ACI4PC_08775 [Oscillospiraceae bacterium]